MKLSLRLNTFLFFLEEVRGHQDPCSRLFTPFSWVDLSRHVDRLPLSRLPAKMEVA